MRGARNVIDFSDNVVGRGNKFSTPSSSCGLYGKATRLRKQNLISLGYVQFKSIAS